MAELTLQYITTMSAYGLLTALVMYGAWSVWHWVI